MGQLTSKRDQYLVKIHQFLIVLACLLLVGLPLKGQDNMILELSGYIGGEADEHANAAAISKSGGWNYMYVVGQSTSKESWMPHGPRRGGIAPGCAPEEVGGLITIQCSEIGPSSGFIARYTMAGKPSGFAFIGTAGGATEVTDIAVSDSGDVFIAGWTADRLTHGRNFYNGGDRDAFVAKLDTTKFDPHDTGPALEESSSVTVWAKHLGGEGRDQALAIAINDDGNPVVVGETTSRDYPTRGTETGNQTDDDGVRFENEVQNKKIDTETGNPKVGKGKFLKQPNPNAYRGGRSDAFVTVVSSDGLDIVQSFFLGGERADIARDLALTKNTIYIAGSTQSPNVKSPWGTLAGGAATGNKDAFLFKNRVLPANPDTGRIISSDETDQIATGIAIVEDSGGKYGIVAAGHTGGSLAPDLNITNNVPQDLPMEVQASEFQGGTSDGFVVFYKSISDDIQSAEQFQYLGGDGTDRVTGLQVLNKDYSPNNTIYLTGSTDSPYFPALGEIPDPLLTAHGERDAFMMELNDNASEIQYSALYGGSSNDRGLGLVVTQNEIFNIVGSTNSSDLKTKRNPDYDLSGSTDGFLTRLTPSREQATNLSLKVSSPAEMKMEQTPVVFDIEISNTTNVDAEEIKLDANFEGGHISSTPDYCTDPQGQTVTCSIDQIGNRLTSSLNIGVTPYDAPAIVKGTFQISAGTREYVMRDNTAEDSTEVISRPDLQIEFVEVTQGIQDRRHSIPLVQNKTTYARAYVRAVRHTVDSGELLVDVETPTVEMEGWDQGEELDGSPIRPVRRAPTSLRQVPDSINGTTVSINANDTLKGHIARGVVGSGNDGFRFTGSRPSVNLDNPGGAITTIDDENRIVISGEGQSGNTSYTVEVESNLTQKETSVSGFDVGIQADDEVQGDTLATGNVGAGADGFTFRGELQRIKLDNPSAAKVLVEDGGTILIEGNGGGTEYTIRDTTKLDANTFDRHGREAFDFRLPSEWVEGENIELAASVNPKGSITEMRGDMGNTFETESFKLWPLAPVCMRTQPVRTSNNLPDADLRDTDKGREILNFAETLLPTPRIRVYPNYNDVTPSWFFEAGGNFEFGDDPGEPPFYNENDHDGAKVNTLLFWRSVTGTSPSWCDNQGARTHWVGLINEDDYAGGPSGQAPTKRPFSNVLWFALGGDDGDDWSQINSPWGGETLAHELGHNYGHPHIHCPNPPGPADDNPGEPEGAENAPFPNCQLGPTGQDKFYGYDTRNPLDNESPPNGGQVGIHPDLPAIEPSVSSNMSDLMSYADHSWTASYTWMSLWNTFRSEHCSAESQSDSFYCTEPPPSKTAPAFGRSPQSSFLILGEKNKGSGGPQSNRITSPSAMLNQQESTLESNVQKNGKGSVVPNRVIIVNGSINVEELTSNQFRAVEMRSQVLNTEEAQELLETGPKNPDYPVRVELRNQNGQVLESTFATLTNAADTAPPGRRHISLALPWSQDVASIHVLLRGQSLASQPLGSSSPTLEIVAPSGGETLTGENFTARWNVSGIQNTEDVRYIIHYTSNGGESWRMISMGQQSEQIKLNPSNLPGSTESAQIRVTSIYQGRSSTAVSEAFTVTGHSPDVNISSPESGRRYRTGGQVYLKGMAFDPDDGYLMKDALKWEVENSKGEEWVAGSGEKLTIFDISPGSYTVTLTANDSDGTTSSATRQFFVGQSGNTTNEKTGDKQKQQVHETESKSEVKNKQRGRSADSDTKTTVTLIPRGGLSLPGVSSFGDITGEVGPTLEGKNSVFTWGGSFAFGETRSYNFRLTGLHRSGTIATTLQNDEITTTEIDESFTAFSADIVIRPLPRILVQPYVIAGAGLRKISREGSIATNDDSKWKATVPVGVGVDVQLGDDGLLFGVEAVDYFSNFSGDGDRRHDAFIFGFIGIPF